MYREGFPVTGRYFVGSRGLNAGCSKPGPGDEHHELVLWGGTGGIVGGFEGLTSCEHPSKETVGRYIPPGSTP